MNARQILESIFRTGAVFLDTSDHRWLTTSRVFFINSAGKKTSAVIRQFVDYMARGKENRNALTADSAATFQSLVDNHGLVAVFRAENSVKVIGKPGFELDSYQKSYLKNRLELTDEVQVGFTANVVEWSGWTVASAGEVLYGRVGNEYPSKWQGQELTPDDKEFIAREVRPEPKVGTVLSSPEEVGGKSPDQGAPLNFVKGHPGRGKIHPGAKLFGV